MKNIKSRVRSNLSDESLEAELICSVTGLEPDYMKLCKEIEHHISNWLSIFNISKIISSIRSQNDSTFDQSLEAELICSVTEL